MADRAERIVSFWSSAVLVFAQLLGFMSWRLAQIAKIAKTARTVATTRITRTQMRRARPAYAAGTSPAPLPVGPVGLSRPGESGSTAIRSHARSSQLSSRSISPPAILAYGLAQRITRSR